MDALLKADELEILLLYRMLGSVPAQAQDRASAPKAEQTRIPQTPLPVPAQSGSLGSADQEDPATSEKVIALLRAAGATFQTLSHTPTRTSEEVSMS